jgi:transcriptional regulator with XRE-family HTH domain
MTSPVTAPFAASLRRLRREHGWSQRELSAKSGVSIASISTVKREMNGPGLQVAVQLARAFNVSLDAMVAGEAGRTVNEPASDARAGTPLPSVNRDHAARLRPSALGWPVRRADGEQRL